VPLRFQNLLDELEPPKIFFGPIGLELDHRLEGPDGKSVASRVRGDRNPSAVGLVVALMRSALPHKKEAVLIQGGNDLAGFE
jgi:hypothetical protein